MKVNETKYQYTTKMNQKVHSKDKVIHLEMSNFWEAGWWKSKGDNR